MSFGSLWRKPGEGRQDAECPLPRAHPEPEAAAPPGAQPQSGQAPSREQRLEALLRETQPQRAAGRIAGDVAHDLNNSLAIVAGSLDLLEHRIGAEAQARQPHLSALIERARGAVQRAADLTAGLHALSRQQGKAARSTDLGPLVAALVPLLIAVVGRRVQVQVVIATDLPPVWVEPDRLKAALVALCLNAREAMADGGQLAVDLAAETTAAGSFVRLRVTDRGVGMAPEVAGRAAAPFFTTKCLPGTVGLGLTEVASFAHEHGGALQIETAPEEGTAVSLLLPCADPPTGGSHG